MEEEEERREEERRRKEASKGPGNPTDSTANVLAPLFSVLYRFPVFVTLFLLLSWPNLPVLGSQVCPSFVVMQSLSFRLSLCPHGTSTPGFPVLFTISWRLKLLLPPSPLCPLYLMGNPVFPNPQLWCPGTLSAPILQLTLLLFSPARSIITHAPL